MLKETRRWPEKRSQVTGGWGELCSDEAEGWQGMNPGRGPKEAMERGQEAAQRRWLEARQYKACTCGDTEAQSQGSQDRQHLSRGQGVYGSFVSAEALGWVLGACTSLCWERERTTPLAPKMQCFRRRKEGV